MRAHTVAVVALGALLVTGCSSVSPLPITAADMCFNCRRPISDPSVAGEVITEARQALKFKSTACMVRWLKANPEAASTARAIYVTDWTSGRMIRATSATFVPYVVVEGYKKTPDYIAFHAPVNAAAAAAEHKSTPIKWQQVLEKAE
jgi:nitrous oxide reductase accessory protein NosL